MPNQTIPISKANAMIQQYVTYMTTHGVDMNFQTQTVVFDTTLLMEYLDRTKGYTDEFRICIGVYPNDESKAGRITAIVWPYKNGQPASRSTDAEGKGGGGKPPLDPFNDGGLLP